IGGLEVHVARDGQRGRPTLMLLHGNSASLHTWDVWVDALAVDYDIVRIDLPGFGLTGPHPQADYTIDAYVATVAGVVDALGLQSMTLIGNSLGGNVAWRYALEHPDTLSGLVLIDASGFPIREKKPSLVFRLARMPGISSVLPMFAPKSLYRKSLLEVYADDTQVTDELVQRYFELSLREGNRQAFVDAAGQRRAQPVDRLWSIAAPTLILWGAQDEWIPVEHAHQFAAAIAHSQLIVYDNIGHLPMEEAPQQSVADTLAFLTGGVHGQHHASD
ncbi:MAG: alpha/beta hydrolase, partial [Pseudomonadota bacterium]